MADRTAAGIFASVFEILVDHMGNHPITDKSVRGVARQVAELTKRYDFSPGDMENGDFDLREAMDSIGIKLFDIDCEEGE